MFAFLWSQAKGFRGFFVLFLVPFRGLNSIRFESTFQASVGCRPRAACLLKHACGGGGVVALREGKARILAHEHRGLEIKIEFKFPFSNVVFPRLRSFFRDLICFSISQGKMNKF